MQRNNAEPIEPVVKVNRNKTNPKRRIKRLPPREESLSLSSLSKKQTGTNRWTRRCISSYIEIENRKRGRTRLLHLGEKEIFRDLGRSLEFAARAGKNPKTYSVDVQRGEVVGRLERGREREGKGGRMAKLDGGRLKRTE